MNQNPEVAVTGNSPVAEMINSISRLYKDDVLNNFPDTESVDNVMKNIIPSYYEKWSEKYIIDRQAWGHESVLQQLKNHLTNDIKIIVLVRPLEQVLASFIRLSKSSKTNMITSYGDTVEKQCNGLMADNGMVDLQLKSIRNLLKFENSGLSHFIEYDDLVNNTKDELDKAYDFLEIPRFNHKFNDLKQISHKGIMYDDSIYGMDLHKIHTDNVQQKHYSINDYLPKNIIERCKSYNFWHD